MADLSPDAIKLFTKLLGEWRMSYFRHKKTKKGLFPSWDEQFEREHTAYYELRDHCEDLRNSND